MSGDKAFFDTNVLLYMFGGDPGKRARAIELFRDYTRSARLVLSTQVVQEFYAAGSKKLKIPRSELLEAIASLLDCPLVTVGPAEITEAIEIEERHGISFWDALIVAAAQGAGAELLYTEDLNNGQQYGTVIARNPFQLCQ